MKSSNMMWSLMVFSILIFGNAILGYAATVTVTPAGNGQFVVQGDGFAGVEGIEIDIQYDKTALANPTVKPGNLISGMPMVIHNQPGQLGYSGTYAYPKTTPAGSGIIAVITFDVLGDPATNVSLAAQLRDAHGTSLSVTKIVTRGTGTSSIVQNTDNGSSSVSGSGVVPVNPYSTSLGSVSMLDAGTTAEAKINGEASPPDSKEGNIQKLASEKEILPATSETATPAAPQKKYPGLNKSVLERFQEFQGEKSPNNLIVLFKSAMEGSAQEPPLVLSDGKANVRVLVELPITDKYAPSFAVKEAKLVSLKKTGDSAWEVDVLPNKGTFEAAVIILHDGKTIRLPLTVAPPLSANPQIGKLGKLTEADFNTFLKERGTDKAPSFDLNGDGKRDYIDDYIYTANYLAKANAEKAAMEKIPER